MSDHIYRAYGLCIASEISCPELSPGDGPPDVLIRLGEVPETLEDCFSRASYYQLAPTRTLVSARGVARYLASGGDRLVVDRVAGAEEGLVRLFLLGSGLGALLMQRGLLLLHGSCIRVRNGAVVFLGCSGRGKSTLATAFHARGHEVLADDVTALTVSREGEAFVLPGPCHVSLLPDARSLLGLGQALEPVAKRGEKTLLRVRGDAGPDEVPLRRLYVLTAMQAGDPTISDLRGVDLFQCLLENLYRPEFLGTNPARRALYGQCMAVARSAALHRVAWPRDRARFARFVDLLATHLSDESGAPADPEVRSEGRRAL